MTKTKLVIAPQVRADPTRAKILKAARKLFVVNGFAGTSIGKIAEKAKINHSLIFHHFGNKQGLWKSVKANIVESSNQSSPALPDLNQSFPDFMKKLIIQTISFYQDNPDIIRMISWQRLEMDNKKEIGLTLSTESQAWLDAFKHYQNKGCIRTDLKPEFILTFVLSVVSSTAMDPNTFIQKSNELEKYIKFCVDSFLKLLK